MTTYRLAVVIEKDPDGYFGFCPGLQGCYTQGETYEEVLANLKDAMRLHGEDRLEAGEAIPQPESVALTSLDVAV
jgi:predicted RNase H-like HicB family nuclease